jgi:hypothetical protein
MTLRKYLQLLEDPSSNKVNQVKTYLISHGSGKGYDDKPLEMNGKFDAHTYFALVQFMKSKPNDHDKEELKNMALGLMDAPITAEDSAIMQQIDQGGVILGPPNPEKKVDGKELPSNSNYGQQIAALGGEGNGSSGTDKTKVSGDIKTNPNALDDNETIVDKDKVTVDKKLAARDPGTAKLQEWLSKLGLKGMNGKNLQTDGRFGPNTYYACRKFMASNPNPKLKAEFESLMQQVHHTMWISPATMKKIDDSLPLPKVQAQSDKFMGGQPGYDEAGNKIAESLDRILKLARI